MPTEQESTQNLHYHSPAWPARFGAIGTLLVALIIYFVFHGIPLFVLVVSFAIAIFGIFFAADTMVNADKISRTLIVAKKRILGGTKKEYKFDDIVYFNQNIRITTGEKGEKSEKSVYSLALKSLPGSALYDHGRIPVPISIPTSPLTMFSNTARNIQEYARARALADFVGVPLYVNGSQHDVAINTLENIPGYADVLKNMPNIISQAKTENDKVAHEVLGDKYPN